MTSAVWTAEAVRALGVRTTVPVAGEILAGLSATQAYELAKRGGFPVPVLSVGRRLVVPVAAIVRFLDLDSPHAEAAGPPSPAASTDHARQTAAERPGHAHHTRRQLRAIGT